MKNVLTTISAIILGLTSVSAYAQNADRSALEFRTIVIDPGHGGKDQGAPGYDRKTCEKAVVLSIAKKFGALINETYPNVNVVYTRSTDVFVDLIERAHIATRANADLFVSIHGDSVDSHSPHGSSVHVYGSVDKSRNNSLFEISNKICKQENSVILLEDDYGAKYQDFDPDDPSSSILFSLLHNAYYEQSLQFASFVASEMKDSSIGLLGNDGGVFQNNYAVLRCTSVPSVLVECGFMSNKSDFDFLKSEEGQNFIARKLLNALSAYMARNGQPLPPAKAAPAPVEEPAAEPAEPVEPAAPVAPVVETKPVEKTPEKVEEKVVEKPAGTRYGIQVLASSKILAADNKYFAGREFNYYKVGTVYKYVIFESESLEEVKNSREKILGEYPDCFIVRIEGENLSRAM